VVKPWVHYIPVKIDYSDLEKYLKWANANKNEAQKISHRAQTISHKFLNLRNMQCYMGLLVLEYSELLI
jgi:hypothetical protein